MQHFVRPMHPLYVSNHSVIGSLFLTDLAHFSGYLFVRLELGKDNLAPIRSTLGCRDLVRVAPGLVPVPNAVMTPLLSLNSSPKTSEELFIEVDEVSVAQGAFAGLQGIFKLAKGKDRAEVFIALLGKERPITVVLDDLAKP